MDTQEDHAPVVKPAQDLVPTTVRIPYSLVPSIDFSSPAYRRALSTLGKQILKDKHDKPVFKSKDKTVGSSAVCKDHCDSSHSFVTCPSGSPDNDETVMEPGASFVTYFSFSLTDLSVFSFLDKSVPTISDDDHLVLKRAADLVSNDTIIDLVNETDDPNSFLKDALRLQIVQGCQFLRSYLTSVNLLMKKYNALKPSVALSSKN